MGEVAGECRFPVDGQWFGCRCNDIANVALASGGNLVQYMLRHFVVGAVEHDGSIDDAALFNCILRYLVF